MPTTTATAPPVAGRLNRAIGRVQATALVIGIIVGASIFVQPSEITRELPSLPWIIGAWLVAGLLSLVGALICAELSSAFPGSGGVYVFLSETLSPAVGFLWGWAMFWSMHTGIIAAVAMINARYVGQFIELGDVGTRLFAIGAILVVSVVNCFGVRHGSRLQAAFTIAKLGAIVLLLGLGFLLGDKAQPAAAVAGTTPDTGALLRGIAAGLFAFGGWHMVTYTAGETVRPQRTLPIALIAGMLIVIACYLLLNLLYLYLLPIEQVATSQRIAADALAVVLGDSGAGAISILVIFSTIGALAGLILAGPRVYFAMAANGSLPAALAAVDPRYQTPVRAILLQAIWACVLVLTGSYVALFTRVIYTEWLFFALMAIGLLRVRRRPGYAPAWRLGGGALMPGVFAVGALAIALGTIVSRPTDSMIGLGFVLAGIPVYLYFTREGGSRAHR